MSNSQSSDDHPSTVYAKRQPGNLAVQETLHCFFEDVADFVSMNLQEAETLSSSRSSQET
jgi:hypothetical protein